jgi:hypothetical protein
VLLVRWWMDGDECERSPRLVDEEEVWNKVEMLWLEEHDTDR